MNYRNDEKEILKIYNNKTIRYYYNARGKKTFINDNLAAPYLRDLLKKEISGNNVLDVGCGFGDDIAWCLKNNVKSIIGLEINQKFINLAQKNALLKTFGQRLMKQFVKL